MHRSWSTTTSSYPLALNLPDRLMAFLGQFMMHIPQLLHSAPFTFAFIPVMSLPPISHHSVTFHLQVVFVGFAYITHSWRIVIYNISQFFPFVIGIHHTLFSPRRFKIVKSYNPSFSISFLQIFLPRLYASTVWCEILRLFLVYLSNVWIIIHFSPFWEKTLAFFRMLW